MNDSATPNRFDRGVEDLGNVVEWTPNVTC